MCGVSWRRFTPILRSATIGGERETNGGVRAPETQYLQMLKTQQKIAGCFRSERGTRAFARLRGYLSNLMQRDVFYCASGDMWMSVNLTERLLERYGTQAAADAPEAMPPYSVWWHGRRQYCCPGCGIRLQEDLACGRCGKSLRDLLMTIVELHLHRGEMTPYRSNSSSALLYNSA